MPTSVETHPTHFVSALEHTQGVEKRYQRTGGLNATDIHSDTHRLPISNTCSNCHRKCHWKFCKKKIPTLALLCKTLQRMVKIFPLHREARSWNCRLFQELMANIFLFVAETWFTLNRNVDKQNNRQWCTENPIQFINLLCTASVRARCVVGIYTIMGPTFVKES